MMNRKSLQRVDDFSIKIKSIYLDAHIWTCIHTHIPIPTTLKTHSQWSAQCSRQSVGAAYLEFYGGKKKRTLLFEQISKESRYEPEVQVTPLSLILLTAFLKTAYPCGSD